MSVVAGGRDVEGGGVGVGVGVGVVVGVSIRCEDGVRVRLELGQTVFVVIAAIKKPSFNNTH